MDIAIDEGNNRIKCGLFLQGELQEDRVFLNPLDCLKWTSEQKANRLAYTSVKSNSVFKREADIEITAMSKLPISLDYETPQTLGVDRICAVVGSMNALPTNKLIIDLGTCATFEILLNNSAYIGGLISPGLKMRFRAMNNYTDVLPLVNEELSPEENWMRAGKSTRDCMIAGTVAGMAEEINGNIKRIKDTYQVEEIFLTGGDSTLFESYIKESIFVDRNLVLKGVDRIAEYHAHI